MRSSETAPLRPQRPTSVPRAIGVSPTNRPALGIAYPSPPASDRLATAAALLAAEILDGSDASGRLARAIDPTRNSQEVSTRFTPRQESGLLIVILVLPARRNVAPPVATPDPPATVNKETPPDGWERRLLTTVASLISDPPTQRELALARQRLLGRFAQEQESNTGLAAAVGYAEMVGGDGPEALRSRIMQATTGDVLAFARTYLSRPLAVCHLLPADTPQPSQK